MEMEEGGVVNQHRQALWLCACFRPQVHWMTGHPVSSLHIPFPLPFGLRSPVTAVSGDPARRPPAEISRHSRLPKFAETQSRRGERRGRGRGGGSTAGSAASAHGDFCNG